MKHIPLSQNKFTLVDDADYDWLMQWKWSATQGSSGVWYAMRMQRGDGHNRIVYMHREVVKAPAGLLVDHCNRNGLDNQRHNLRLATHANNTHNSRKQKRSRSSKYKGVGFEPRTNKFYAAISVNGRRISGGHYYSEVEAALAYDKLARTHFGEFAFLNLPDQPAHVAGSTAR